MYQLARHISALRTTQRPRLSQRKSAFKKNASYSNIRSVSTYVGLMNQNRQWVTNQLSLKPDYFDTLASGQSPQYMMIACSDSRVTPNTITQTDLGDIFAVRNVANQVQPTDTSAMAAIEYAVTALKVPNIIVCGHHHCGGVAAAMSDTSYSGAIGQWIQPIRNLYHDNKGKLDRFSNQDDREIAMIELNVIQQVEQLATLPVIQSASNPPLIHGWVFNLGTGEIRAVTPQKD